MNDKIEMKQYFYVDKKGYVFRSIARYNTEVKGSRPEKIYIGKLCNDDKKYFIPNKRYFELYPTEAKKEEAPIQADSISFGNFILLQKIIEKLHLKECLSYAFSSSDDDTIELDDKIKSDLVLDLASYMIKEESSDMQHFPDYCFKNAIASKKLYSGSDISKFFKEEITDRVRDRFLLKWQYFNKTSFNEPIFVCYDSTNFNSVSEGITFLEYGHAKDDNNKAQFNLECVIKSKDGLPLAYDTFPGSIIDISQCQSMLSLLTNLGYKNITIVCDRGYISKQNIKDIINKGYSFLFMVKDNLVIKKNIVYDHGDEVRDNASCFYPEYDIFAKTYEDIIYDDIKVYHHVFYTSNISKEDRKYFFDSIESKEKELNSMLDKKIEKTKKQLDATYGRYFDLVYGEIQGDKLILKGFSKNNDKINKEYRMLSFYTIITDKPMTISEVIEQYKLRDRVEKSFMCIKTNFNLKTFYTHSNETTLSKVFVCFIASIIRSVLVDKTRKLRKETKDSKSYTVKASILEISKIEATRTIFKNQRVIKYILTRKQKKILDAFSIKEKEVDDELKSFIDLDQTTKIKNE